MKKPNFEAVVEAVHYSPDGQVAWIRAYKRIGAIFTDLVKIDRSALIAELKAGNRFVIGQRVTRMAGTFEVGEALRLANKNGGEIIVLGAAQADQDFLPGVPIV